MAEEKIPFNVLRKIFEQKGGVALKAVREEIVANFKGNNDISKSLRHFSRVTLEGTLPVFPGLITCSCEAVGGAAQETALFGEAIILISGGADLHDDVIDQSPSKSPKKTVLGKFGSSNAILAGDILLFQGLAKLRQATETLSANQRDTIWALVVDSVLEICKGEALEIQLRNCRFDVTPIAYYEVINCKAVVPELAMKIGAVAGKGDVDSVEALGQFGRAYGVVSLVSEEFIDLFDFDELKSRLQNECPPLPLIYALQNSKTRSMLLPMITDLVNEEVHKKIVDLVLGSSEVKSLNKKIRSTVYKQAEKMEVKNKNIREELKALIMAPLEYLDFNPF